MLELLTTITGAIFIGIGTGSWMAGLGALLMGIGLMGISYRIRARWKNHMSQPFHVWVPHENPVVDRLHKTFAESLVPSVGHTVVLFEGVAYTVKKVIHFLDDPKGQVDVEVDAVSAEDYELLKTSGEWSDS